MNIFCCLGHVCNWLLRRILQVKQSSYLREYERTVNGGPAPRPWREREGLPEQSRWPKRPDGTIDLVVGDQRSGRVRPVKADTFPVIGGALPLVEDAVKVEKEDPGRGPQ